MFHVVVAVIEGRMNTAYCFHISSHRMYGSFLTLILFGIGRILYSGIIRMIDFSPSILKWGYPFSIPIFW